MMRRLHPAFSSSPRSGGCVFIEKTPPRVLAFGNAHQLGSRVRSRGNFREATIIAHPSAETESTKIDLANRCVTIPRESLRDDPRKPLSDDPANR